MAEKIDPKTTEGVRGRRRLHGRVMAFGSSLVVATMLAPASAQIRSGPNFKPPTATIAPPAVVPPTPPPAPGVPPATATPPTAGTPPAAAGSTAPGGKKPGDTGGLPQFKDEIEFEPRPAGYKVQFSLEDADLPELIKVMGQLTGKRFIFGGKVRNIKATIYSPQKVTVAEAYQAFLSILETNGLTVIPHGKFLKIVESPGIVTQTTPIYGPGTANAAEDRFITRLHRLQYVTADEVANVLTHFKSRDGDITIYSPGNLLIITDTGTNIKRMMSIVEEIDVAGIGDQIWVEPIHYSGAQEIATKLNEIFDVNKGAGGAPGGGRGPGSQAVESRVTKIIP
jgi:general secretion pathway protein D